MNRKSFRSLLAPLLVSSTLVAAGLAWTAPASAEMKVAVVDVRRAVEQTEDGMRAQAMLKKVFDNKQQELNRKQQDMQKQRDEIDKQSRVLSKEALQKRVEEWQRQMLELQTTFVEYNKELEKKQKELTDPIFERVMASVKRLAGQEGYDLIVDRATVAFVRTDLDLTDRIIQLANGGGAGPTAPKGSGSPAPGPVAPPAAHAPAKPNP